jgi:uncharacterized protein (TIRG00374 family)
VTAAVQRHLPAVDVLSQGPRLFATPADEPRARRASDVIALLEARFALATISLLLVGGNFATEVLFALALATFARSFGFQIGLGEAVLINVSVALLSGLMPIPGAVGVAEGGLTFGLVQTGIPEEVAFAIALVYRMASFYLPPIWGFFALRWLERNEHL